MACGRNGLWAEPGQSLAADGAGHSGAGGDGLAGLADDIASMAGAAGRLSAERRAALRLDGLALPPESVPQLLRADRQLTGAVVLHQPERLRPCGYEPQRRLERPASVSAVAGPRGGLAVDAAGVRPGRGGSVDPAASPGVGDGRLRAAGVPGQQRSAGGAARIRFRLFPRGDLSPLYPAVLWNSRPVAGRRLAIFLRTISAAALCVCAKAVGRDRRRLVCGGIVGRVFDTGELAPERQIP